MTGLEELFAHLDELGVTVRQAARGACNAMAQAVKKDAVVIARMQGLVSTGALVNNISVKRQRGTPDNIAEYHIGVRYGPQAKGAEKIAVRGADGRIRFEYTDNPFYWHMWEFGHYNIFLRRHAAARAFLRPAMMANDDKLAGIAIDYLSTRIERTTARWV